MFEGLSLLELFLIFSFFVSIGSFLNVVAYRLVHDKSFFQKRSFCPHCLRLIPWRYNIPLLSFVMLGGTGACCKKPISWLYPFIELLSGVVLTTHFLCSSSSFTSASLVYYIPLICLLIAIRTDLEAMVILTPFSLWMAPVGIGAAFFGLLPITVCESFIGAVSGYLFLYVLNRIAWYVRGQQGVGEGDMDLLALIGAFWGIQALFYIVWGASIIGLLMSLFFIQGQNKILGARIPFGPSLALSACLVHLLSLCKIFCYSGDCFF